MNTGLPSASNCTNVGGATSATYALGYFDLGHRVRVVVTAANARGSTSAASLAGGVVSVACTSTVSPSMSAAAIANAIVSAKDGDTVCMAGGSYPSIAVTGANHASYVTVQPAPGATASVNGIQVDGSSFLRIQGLSMSGGVNLRDTHSRGGHDYQIIANTLGPATYGVTIDGNAAPVTNAVLPSV